jgi:hypothetical protein
MLNKYDREKSLLNVERDLSTLMTSLGNDGDDTDDQMSRDSTPRLSAMDMHRRVRHDQENNYEIDKYTESDNQVDEDGMLDEDDNDDDSPSRNSSASSGVDLPPNTPLKLLTFNSKDFSDIPTSQAKVKLDKSDNDLTQHGAIVDEYLGNLKLDLQSHLAAIKTRLLKQKEKELLAKDDYFIENMHKQQNIIDSITATSSKFENLYYGEVKRSELFTSMLAKQNIKKSLIYSSKYSLSKIFREWYKITIQNININRLEKISIKFYNKKLKYKYFQFIIKYINIEKLSRHNNESKTRYDLINKQIIEKYENDINILNNELNEVNHILQSEILRRKQLEEDLRRMFLKNITAMNMEALSLFQHPNTLPLQLNEFGPNVIQQKNIDKCNRENEYQENLKSSMKAQQNNVINNNIVISGGIPSAQSSTISSNSQQQQPLTQHRESKVKSNTVHTKNIVPKTTSTVSNSSVSSKGNTLISSNHNNVSKASQQSTTDNKRFVSNNVKVSVVRNTSSDSTDEEFPRHMPPPVPETLNIMGNNNNMGNRRK